MRVLFVVDSITDINQKILKLQTRFGGDISYVVKAPLVKLFETFGYTSNAIYTHNLSSVLHNIILKCPIDDIVICYASLNFNDSLLNKFISAIANKQKVVNVVPKYNSFESMYNSAYNSYVNFLFKSKDSLASPKLQFLPIAFVTELIKSSIANRLFEINAKFVTNIYIDDVEQSKNLKVKPRFNPFSLLPIIVALVLTATLITLIAFVNFNFLLGILFVLLYLLDIFMAIIQNFKRMFDNRFLK